MKKSKIYDIGKDFGVSKDNIDNIIINITELTKTKIFLLDEIDDKYTQFIIRDLERCKNGEPIEYIINKACFYSLDFFVDHRVLIPRNDTEVLVDSAIESIIKYDNSTLIDVGTGSSCIAISVLKNTSKVKYAYVIDVSSKALEVSEINLKKHSLINKVIQIKGNLLQKLLGETEHKISDNIIITANLPYIKNKDFENMDFETIKYEPSLALYGGEHTGFEIYENLIHQCQTLKNHYKNKKIILFIEIGFDQYDYSKKYLEEKGLKGDYYKDNSGINRCIKIEI